MRRAGKIRHLPAANCILNGHKIESPDFGIEPKDRRQHEHGGNHGVHEEFYRGVDFAPVAVHSDQQRHRNQRGFPEEVEQEQIQRDEDADHRGFQHQQQDEEFLHPLMNRVPRNQHAQRCQERGQYHQPHGDSVHAQVVVNVGRGNPRRVKLVLESGNRPV